MNDRPSAGAGPSRRSIRILKSLLHYFWAGLGSVPAMLGFFPPHVLMQMTESDAQPPTTAWVYRPGATLSDAELEVWESLTAVIDEPEQY